MSVVMAVKQGNRIWFGADTQATRGGDRYNQLSPNDFKVMKFDNGVLLSATGETVTSQILLAHPDTQSLVLEQVHLHNSTHRFEQSLCNRPKQMH